MIAVLSMQTKRSVLVPWLAYVIYAGGCVGLVRHMPGEVMVLQSVVGWKLTQRNALQLLANSSLQSDSKCRSIELLLGGVLSQLALLITVLLP